MITQIQLHVTVKPATLELMANRRLNIEFVIVFNKSTRDLDSDSLTI